MTTCPFCHHDKAKLFRDNEIARNGAVRSIMECKECSGLYPSPRMANDEGLQWVVGEGKHEAPANGPKPLRNIDLRYRVGRLLQPVAWPFDFRVWLSRQMNCAGRALDVGSNDGAFLQVLRALGFDAVGLEPQGHLVDIANDHGLDVRRGAFPGDMPDDLRSEQFDLITFNETIFYFPDLRNALEEAQRMLRPGGHVLIKAHLGTSAYYDGVGRSRLLRYGDNVQAIATPNSMNHWLEQSGFDIVAKAAGHWPRASDGVFGRVVDRFLGFAPGGMPLLSTNGLDVLMILARVPA